MDTFLRAASVDMVLWLTFPLLFAVLIGYVLLRARGGQAKKEPPPHEDPLH